MPRCARHDKWGAVRRMGSELARRSTKHCDLIPCRSERYKQVEADSLRFIFKYDDDAPDLLHIYARHLNTIEEAIETFFDGETRWNAEHSRFETFTETHGLFWFWIERDSVVMVISCFVL